MCPHLPRWPSAEGAAPAGEGQEGGVLGEAPSLTKRGLPTVSHTFNAILTEFSGDSWWKRPNGDGKPAAFGYVALLSHDSLGQMRRELGDRGTPPPRMTASPCAPPPSPGGPGTRAHTHHIKHSQRQAPYFQQ